MVLVLRTDSFVVLVLRADIFVVLVPRAFHLVVMVPQGLHLVVLVPHAFHLVVLVLCAYISWSWYSALTFRGPGTLCTDTGLVPGLMDPSMPP